VTPHQTDVDAPRLPPLAAPDASDDDRARAIMARMVARYGAPTLEGIVNLGGGRVAGMIDGSSGWWVEGIVNLFGLTSGGDHSVRG
jgi:hypothetical protein